MIEGKNLDQISVERYVASTDTAQDKGRQVEGQKGKGFQGEKKKIDSDVADKDGPQGHEIWVSKDKTYLIVADAPGLNLDRQRRPIPPTYFPYTSKSNFLVILRDKKGKQVARIWYDVMIDQPKRDNMKTNEATFTGSQIN